MLKKFYYNSSGYAGISLAEILISMLLVSIFIVVSISVFSKSKSTSNDTNVNTCINTEKASSITFPFSLNNASPACRNVIDSCNYGRGTSCSSVISYANGSNAEQKTIAIKVLKASCDIGSRTACEYFITQCINDTNKCNDPDSDNDLHYYLSTTPDNYTPARMQIYEYIYSLLKTNKIDGLSNLIEEITNNYAISQNNLSYSIFSSINPINDIFFTYRNSKCVEDANLCKSIVTECNNNISASCMSGYNSNLNTSCLRIKSNIPDATSGVYKLTPNGGENAVKAYCDMTTDGGGWASIFTLTGSLTLDSRSNYFSIANDDHDSYLMWTDYALRMSSINSNYTDGQDWYTLSRDRVPDTIAKFLPDRVSGLSSVARPVIFPATNKVVWFDPLSRLIKWDTYSVSFDSVGITDTGLMDGVSTVTGSQKNFYFISDGVSSLNLGYAGGPARLLSFNFKNGVILSRSAATLEPTNWWSTEEDAFGHHLFTVNGRVMYYKGAGVFVLGGSLKNPNSNINEYTITEYANPLQPGLDFFGFVDPSGYLWFADWGHDNGGYFNLGADTTLGVGRTNIMLVN